MHLLRPVLLLLLSLPLAGCITDPGPVGTNQGQTGTFSITIQAFNNGPTNGTATFQLDQEQDVPVLSMLMTNSTGITILLSGPGAPVVGDERDIGEADGLMNGEVRRAGAAGLEVYTLTAGRLTVDGVSANQLVGNIEFTGVQTQGAAPGSVISGSGNFRASGGNALP